MQANNNNVLLNLERLKYIKILCKVKERKHLTFSNVLPDCLNAIENCHFLVVK